MVVGCLPRCYLQQTKPEITKELLDRTLKESRGKIEKNKFLCSLSEKLETSKQMAAQYLWNVLKTGEYTVHKEGAETKILIKVD